ncbi:hypothetical protein CK501_15680 [Halovibrio salipaludis]|uniref:Uncharacterized protein n=1 Tax=Halovibrio salipaludis TaxID=2032626 RepID=A0A2A2EX83_9GAMM|nr:hypothetical protein CK501_15680 [Halovibrio salipaludis]
MLVLDIGAGKQLVEGVVLLAGLQAVAVGIQLEVMGLLPMGGRGKTVGVVVVIGPVRAFALALADPAISVWPGKAKDVP